MTILESITGDKETAKKAVMEALNTKAYSVLETISEEVRGGPKKSEVPSYLRKAKGEAPLTLADLDKEENESPTTKKGLDDLKKKTGITAEGITAPVTTKPTDTEEPEEAKDSSIEHVTKLVAKKDAKE